MGGSGGAAGGPGGGPAGGTAGVAFDTSDATFMADVVQASTQAPIIVVIAPRLDKGAQDYTRQLEQELAVYKGALKLARLDPDQSPMIAGQLNASVYPTTVAFFQGQGLTGFQGAPGPAQLKDFIGRLAEAVGLSGAEDVGSLEQALEMAEKMLDDGHLEDALQTFAAIVGEEPSNARAVAGLLRTLVAAGRIEEAADALARVAPEIAEDPAIAGVRAAIELAVAGAAAAGEITQYEARLAADGNDHEARLGLADALIGAGRNEDAVEQLLEAFRRDREWNDGAAKAKLLTLIESLGPKDPLAGKARRRLSSIIFA